MNENTGCYFPHTYGGYDSICKGWGKTHHKKPPQLIFVSYIQVAARKQHSFPPALFGAHAAGLTSHTVTPTKVVLAKRGDEMKRVESASTQPIPSKSQANQLHDFSTV